ncbi:DUF1422 family protein [Psychromonas sp. MME2]|uniref:DUF1422 family protein n=1 Tax=unclassified Psychromonas TaxID=2614957 RepID=UPI00339CE769
MSHPTISYKWLIYTFLIGLSISACFSILTVSQVSFSIFPFLTLFFTVNKFYGIYIKEGNYEANVGPAWVALFIGIFSYRALIAAHYPELGSNFISITITLLLCIWLMYKLMFGDKRYSA